jgi:RNA polymerase sigma factor (sigma-70 family)
MRAAGEPSVATVVAAREGRPEALDELVAGYLPLVYNIVGRAIGGHSDVDDVVQDTMLRALNGLAELREPESFRSWLVVIAMRQVRNRYRSADRYADLPEDVADPGADFVDLTINRLHLADQRRDLVEATRWLGEEDRELLSLWWLEAAGQLTRADVTAGMGLSPQHTAVRVQRMKAKLDAARSVVRALRMTPRCPEFADLAAGWDGEPSPLWRKRMVRHTRDCRRCQRCQSDLVPAERLLAGLPLVPLPARLLPPLSTPHGPVHGTAHGGVHHTRRFAHLWAHAATKPVVAAIAALAAAGAIVALPAHHPRQAADALPLATTVVRPTTTVPAVVPTTTTAPPTTTTTTTTHRIVPPPAKPASTSTRKGVSTWYFSGVTSALHDVGASWYYDWANTRQNITPPPGVEFVPMMWGAPSVTSANLAAARQQGTELLGFNEPDMASQADMTVTQALDLWPRLAATGMRLGSPAVAYGGDTAGGWLDQFMTGAAARGYRVDFITLHWYGSDFSAAAVGQLKRYVQAVYARYHKPIWLTEYALINFSGNPRYPTQSQQAAFVTGSTRMLDALPYVERYAWFALPSKGDDTGLYTNGTTPTQVGKAYRAAT